MRGRGPAVRVPQQLSQQQARDRHQQGQELHGNYFFCRTSHGSRHGYAVHGRYLNYQSYKGRYRR